MELLHHDRARIFRRWLRLVPALALTACTMAPPSHMPLGSARTQPIGAMLFCAENATECSPQRSTAREIALTPALRQEMRAVQHDLNRAIVPSLDADVAWHYATSSSGNCVQYALEKRRELIRRGWPAGVLQLATVVAPGDVGHLVLIVASTEGDWVLDNLRSDVARWDDLPYRWIARQQGASMADWVSVASHG